jgi:hypothetical protein
MNRLKDIIHNLYLGETMRRQQILLLVLLFACFIFLAACEGEKVDLKKEKNTSSQTHVVVIGSEIEGIYLARAAMDEGLSVIILDPREKPGGQLIQGQMQFLDEPVDDQNHSLLQGRVKDLFIHYKKGEIRKANEFEQYTITPLLKGSQWNLVLQYSAWIR